MILRPTLVLLANNHAIMNGKITRIVPTGMTVPAITLIFTSTPPVIVAFMERQEKPGAGNADTGSHYKRVILSSKGVMFFKQHIIQADLAHTDCFYLQKREFFRNFGPHFYVKHNEIMSKPGYSDRTYRSIAGNAVLSIGCGLAGMGLLCILFTRDLIPWWVSLVAIVIGGLLFWWGDSLRTRKIYVDEETGRVRKNSL